MLMEMKEKKILVIDDSALMRRVICDIINSDKRFAVAAKASDGIEAFDLLSRMRFDGVVLDINMPRMDGIELLKELRKYHIPAKVLIASTESTAGARQTLEALENGAIDFIEKPAASFKCREESFTTEFLDRLYTVCGSRVMQGSEKAKEKNSVEDNGAVKKSKTKQEETGKQVVAIASSTGGPTALKTVITNLPENLNAPVLLVQHMPKSFTGSLAERLDGMSRIKVCEAREGDILQDGVVYISQGGLHMKVVRHASGKNVVHYTDEPMREGVKPCANYLFESLAQLTYENPVCVVLTGMGSDGTEGIRNLKSVKKAFVISQNEETCMVYGMPKSIDKNGLSDLSLPLEAIAEAIVERVGTK